MEWNDFQANVTTTLGYHDSPQVVDGKSVTLYVRRCPEPDCERRAQFVLADDTRYFPQVLDLVYQQAFAAYNVARSTCGH
jgi:hypothetical protein